MTRGFIILTTRVCVCVCVDNDEISCFDVECCCHYLHSCHVESKSMSKNLKSTQTNKRHWWCVWIWYRKKTKTRIEWKILKFCFCNYNRSVDWNIHIPINWNLIDWKWSFWMTEFFFYSTWINIEIKILYLSAGNFLQTKPKKNPKASKTFKNGPKRKNPREWILTIICNNSDIFFIRKKMTKKNIFTFIP